MLSNTTTDLRALRKLVMTRFSALPVGRHLLELTLVTLLAYGGAGLMFVGGQLATVGDVLLWLCGLLLSIYGSVALSTQGHTASHRSYTGSAFWDRVVVCFCFPLSLGLSATYWYYKHVDRHHRAPNVCGWDPDIDIRPPFTVLDTRMRDAGALLGLFYRYQWLILPFVLPLTGFSAQKDGWVHLLRRLSKDRKHKLRLVGDLALTLGHWALWLWLPAVLFGFDVAIQVYLARMACIGLLIFATFAPAHFPHPAIALDAKFLRHDFAERQIWTTLNFKTGPIGDLLCAGVQYQIEHHLFPHLSHTHYAKVSELVKQFCRERRLPHRTIGWAPGVWLSLKSFYRPKAVQHSLAYRHNPQLTRSAVRKLKPQVNTGPRAALADARNSV